MNWGVGEFEDGWIRKYVVASWCCSVFQAQSQTLGESKEDEGEELSEVPAEALEETDGERRSDSPMVELQTYASVHRADRRSIFTSTHHQPPPSSLPSKLKIEAVHSPHPLPPMHIPLDRNSNTSPSQPRKPLSSTNPPPPHLFLLGPYMSRHLPRHPPPSLIHPPLHRFHTHPPPFGTRHLRRLCEL